MRTPLLVLAAAFTLAATAQVPGYVPTNGLIAWYPFNNSMIDAGSYGLDGTAYNSGYGNDRFGGADAAATFNGSSYGLVPSNDLFNTGTWMTVSVWVNLVDATTNQKVLGRTNSSFNSGFILGVESGQVHPEVWNSDGTPHSITAGTVPSGTWCQLAITWASSGYLVVYVNGLAVDSIATEAAPIGANSEPFVIGASPWSQSPTYFGVNGSIDDIGIWDRALSAGEIMQVYESGSTGISRADQGNHPALFPNPTAGSITISAKAAKTGDHYRIVDGAGRCVMEGHLVQGANTLNMEGLKAGSYMVRFADPSVKSMRFVKR